MKSLKIVILLITIIFSCPMFADVSVRGYYKHNGTYVQPYYRSNPNKNLYDNWSTKGNVNPHTGKEGNKNPQKAWPIY